MAERRSVSRAGRAWRADQGNRPPTGVMVGGLERPSGRTAPMLLAPPRPTLGADPGPSVFRSLGARGRAENQRHRAPHHARITCTTQLQSQVLRQPPKPSRLKRRCNQKSVCSWQTKRSMRQFAGFAADQRLGEGNHSRPPSRSMTRVRRTDIPRCPDQRNSPNGRSAPQS